MPREISDESRFRQNRGRIDLNNPQNYIPWIKTRDCFRGDGTRHLIPDLYHTKRIIHLMSNIEKDVYYTLRSNINVIELFEQFPLLPLGKTEELCDKYDIRHPNHPWKKNNIVMTTDFLIMVKGKDGKKKWKACAVKQSSDLDDRRTKEKLFIERMYWESIGVQWGLMSELQINKTYVNNVILCKTGYTGSGDGSLYNIVKNLIIRNKIDVDMYAPINLDDIVKRIRKGDLNIG